jgi:hypothetical protein
VRPELRTRRHVSSGYCTAPMYCRAIALALALMLAAFTAMAMLMPTTLTTLVQAK